LAAHQCKQLGEDDEQERDWIASFARNDGDEGKEVVHLSCLHLAATTAHHDIFLREVIYYVHANIKKGLAAQKITKLHTAGIRVYIGIVFSVKRY